MTPKIKLNRTQKGQVIHVNDLMQTNYAYSLTEPMGMNFDLLFKPELTPKEMLTIGVFGGKYMTDCQNEFPEDWYIEAKLNHTFHDPQLNFFHVNASQSLLIWKEKGWIYHEDPRGWFQWYCRYFMGRRIEEEDRRQIKRWKAMQRHVSQIRNNCKKKDLSCRPVQRQVLLHWAYDSRVM